MARIAVLEYTQHPESAPQHFVSRRLANLFLDYRPNGRKAVQAITRNLLVITIKLTFAKLKALLRPNGPRCVPCIKPPRGPENLLLAYPHRDQCDLSLSRSVFGRG